MMIGALLGLRIGVHQRSGKARQRVQQAMLCVARDLVSLDRAGPGIDDHFAFGPQLMADPPQPDLVHAQHSRGGAQRLLHPIDQGRSTASISRW